jgi:hypothetical protein
MPIPIEIRSQVGATLVATYEEHHDSMSDSRWPSARGGIGSLTEDTVSMQDSRTD